MKDKIVKFTEKYLHGRSTFPSKRDLNLAVVGVRRLNYAILIPSVVLIILAAGIFSKFAVADRLNAMSQAEKKATVLQNELDSTINAIRSYGDTEDSYAHYTEAGLTKEEKNQADRMEAIALINEIVLPRAQVVNWTIQGNEIDLPITGSDLQQLSSIAAELEADERVEYCVVSAATTNDTNNRNITGQVTVYLTGAADEKTEAAEAETEGDEGE